MSEFLKPIEAAERLNVTRKQIYNMIERGDLKAIRLGRKCIRIYSQSLEDVIERSVLDATR